MKKSALLTLKALEFIAGCCEPVSSLAVADAVGTTYNSAKNLIATLEYAGYIEPQGAGYAATTRIPRIRGGDPKRSFTKRQT